MKKYDYYGMALSTVVAVFVGIFASYEIGVLMLLSYISIGTIAKVYYDQNNR